MSRSGGSRSLQVSTRRRQIGWQGACRTLNGGETVRENQAMNLWVSEEHKGAVATSFRISKTLFSGRSRFQQVDVVESAAHGRMLLNDGVVMLSERDEFIYHEMIAHVPLFSHPAPESVLIIGGGDGGTAREVLRHPGVARVVMVEIDALVVDASRKYLPSVSRALDDPRLTVIIDDGVRFAAQTRETFDVAIIDSTDPVGPAEPLFNSDFYRNIAGLLADDGIMITQAESPFYDHDLQAPMFSRQRPFFQKLHMYLYPMLVYPGGLWSFGFASKRLCPIRDFDPDRVAGAGLQTRYYNAAVHRSAFVLPTFIKEALAEFLDPLPV